MENINKFLSINYGFGYGYSDGSGFDSGCGSGCGSGSGFGYDDGGYGSGYGYGYGYGVSYSYSDGSSFDSGFGFGFGDGYDIVMFNNIPIYYVDGVPSIIKQIKNNIAKGFILNRDLTLTPCYIAKIENSFAHASTIKEAVRQASEKAFQKLPVEERIEEFWKCHNKTDKYLARDLWIWHNKLTGSCEMGRNQFVEERGIDLDEDYFTVLEFVNMCKNSYGGKIIEKLITEDK